MPYVREHPPSSGTWQATYRDRAGRRHTKSGFPTERKARLWALDREAEVRAGTHLDPRAGRLTVAAWHDVWWSARVAERTTMAANRSRLDNHILPHWRDWALDEIEPLHVQAWVKRLINAGLAPDTVRSCHGLLSGMLDAAVRARKIPRNPAAGATLPPTQRRPHRYLTREEHELVVAQMAEPWATLVDIAPYVGLRWGELVGLHLPRLDLLRRRLEVVEVLTEVGGKFKVKAYPKSRKSRRTVPLPPHVVDRLAAHLVAWPPRQCPTHVEHPKGQPCGGAVFLGPRGACVSRTRFRQRVWLPAVVAADLVAPLPREHDLRHTYASWLVQAGVTLYEVQHLMGHESSTTTEMYAHLQPDAHDAALRALDRDGVKLASNAAHALAHRGTP